MSKSVALSEEQLEVATAMLGFTFAILSGNSPDSQVRLLKLIDPLGEIGWTVWKIFAETLSPGDLTAAMQQTALNARRN